MRRNDSSGIRAQTVERLISKHRDYKNSSNQDLDLYRTGYHRSNLPSNRGKHPLSSPPLLQKQHAGGLISSDPPIIPTITVPHRDGSTLYIPRNRPQTYSTELNRDVLSEKPLIAVFATSLTSYLRLDFRNSKWWCIFSKEYMNDSSMLSLSRMRLPMIS